MTSNQLPSTENQIFSPGGSERKRAEAELEEELRDMRLLQKLSMQIIPQSMIGLMRRLFRR